jgi:hypothetical protein
MCCSERESEGWLADLPGATISSQLPPPRFSHVPAMPCSALLGSGVQGAVHAHRAPLLHGDAHRLVSQGQAAAVPASEVQGGHPGEARDVH